MLCRCERVHFFDRTDKKLLINSGQKTILENMLTDLAKPYFSILLQKPNKDTFDSCKWRPSCLMHRGKTFLPATTTLLAAVPYIKIHLR